MRLDLGEAISNGIKNLFNKETGILTLLLTFAYLVQDVAYDTVMRSEGLTETPLAVGSSLGTGIGIGIISTVFTVLAVLFAYRMYTMEQPELNESVYSENLLFPALNLVIGTVVFVALVLAGLLAFIIPGLFLLTALYFFSFRIAVEDENFIEGLKSSYRLTKGNIIELFGLGVIVNLTIFIITAPLVALVALGSLRTVLVALTTSVIYNLVTAFLFLGLISISAQAYLQLLEE